MLTLRATPDLFDLAAWERRLEELRADPPGTFRDLGIVDAESHIAALKQPPEKSPQDAPQG